MKNFIQTVLFSLFICCSANAQVSDFHFNTGGIQDITVKNGIMAVLGGNTIWDATTGKYRNIATISVKMNGVWQNLNNTIIRNGKKDSIFISAHSKIQIDSKNNLWFTGQNGLYKFTGSEWSEFFINDEYKLDRRYDLFYISKNDRFFISTSYTKKPKEPIEFSELLTFSNDSLLILEKRNQQVAFLTNAWPVKNNNFFELKDGSIVLAHNPNEKFNTDSVLIHYDITKINQDWTMEHYTMLAFDSIISQKTPTTVFQHSDGTIWFSHYGATYGKWVDGTIENYDCCTGVAYTNDFINYDYLGKDNGFPGGEIPYATYTISEMPDGNLIVASLLKKLTFHFVNNYDKSVRTINNEIMLQNALLIRNNDHPSLMDFHSNILDTLRRNLVEQAGYIGNIQSIHFDTKGTMYINFLGYLLEIPVSNITSVQSGVEVSDAMRVYPNPAENSIRIDGTKEIRTVTASNTLGNEVTLKTKGNNSFEVSHLRPGFYTLQITNNDNSISRSIFIKK
jgi:hypothetical protein